MMNTPEMHVVGGAVRDWALGLETLADVDFLVLAPFSDHEEVLEELGFGRLNSGGFAANFDRQTVKAQHPGLGVVDVKFADTLMQDLAKRDFTMNAMSQRAFMDPETGELELNAVFDPFNGLDSMDDRWVVTVGDAESTLSASPERSLRALRFAMKMGFELSDDLLVALQTPHVLQHVEVLNADMKLNQLRKWTNDCGFLAVMDCLAQFPELRTAIFANVGAKFVPC